MKKYFGTDGIRGIPEESLKEIIVKKICSSVEKILEPASIALILDTRQSCDQITDWIVKGFSENITITNSKKYLNNFIKKILKIFNFQI